MPSEKNGEKKKNSLYNAFSNRIQREFNRRTPTASFARERNKDEKKFYLSNVILGVYFTPKCDNRRDCIVPRLRHMCVLYEVRQ